MEAYHEVISRRPNGQLTPDRAYQLVKLVEQDEAEAERASNAVKFATTPYE